MAMEARTSPGTRVPGWMSIVTSVPRCVSRIPATEPTGTPLSSTVKFWNRPEASGKSVVSTVGLRNGFPSRVTTP